LIDRRPPRFGVERACVVADRGMISAATIATLEARKIDYILGARERSSKEVRETVLHDDGMAVPLTIPRQKGETDLAVKEVKVEGRRYIVCRNEEEARKDAETRATLLAGLQRKLAGGAKGLVGNKGYRRFLAAPEGDGFAIDPAKVEADAQFDGVFVLRTSLSMSALAVVLRYRNLLTVDIYQAWRLSRFSGYGGLRCVWRGDWRWPASPRRRRRAHRSDRSNRGIVCIDQGELATTDRNCAAA
jgi:hypothetical protein